MDSREILCIFFYGGCYFVRIFILRSSYSQLLKMENVVHYYIIMCVIFPHSKAGILPNCADCGK